jgi:hypothetical protein
VYFNQTLQYPFAVEFTEFRQDFAEKSLPSVSVCWHWEPRNTCEFSTCLSLDAVGSASVTNGFCNYVSGTEPRELAANNTPVSSTTTIPIAPTFINYRIMPSSSLTVPNDVANVTKVQYVQTNSHADIAIDVSGMNPTVSLGGVSITARDDKGAYVGTSWECIFTSGSWFNNGDRSPSSLNSIAPPLSSVVFQSNVAGFELSIPKNLLGPTAAVFELSVTRAGMPNVYFIAISIVLMYCAQ